MRLDPRTKLATIICITMLAVMFTTPSQLGLLLLATIVILCCCRVNLNGIRGYLKPVLPLLSFLFVIQVIFSPGGRLLLSLGPCSLVTVGGLTAGAVVVLRIGVVMASALLLTTVSQRDFILGLTQCKIPYEIVFMVTLAARFLPIFRQELTDVVTAVQLRGVDVRQVPWKLRIRLYGSLFFPVLYGALLNAQQLSLAMEARGFRAYPRRTYLRRLEFRSLDYLLLAVIPAVTVVLAWLAIV